MGSKTEYDFLVWTSFPSSAKLINDEMSWTFWPWKIITVSPGVTVKASFKAKQQNVFSPRPSHVKFEGWDGSRWVDNFGVPLKTGRELPYGSFDWTDFTGLHEQTIPPGFSAMRVTVVGGGGTPEAPGVTWFDDLKIYQDGVLIYSDDFSNWSPFIGAGVGAPIGGVAGYLLKEPLGPMVSEVVGAVLGGALGGGVGLLTGLGIIPVPQIPIPVLGAAPEGPGAPARLGKYLITG